MSNFFNSKLMNYNYVNLHHIKLHKEQIKYLALLLDDQNKNSQHPLKPLRIPARLLSFMNKAFPIQDSCSVAKVSQVICKPEAMSLDKYKVISCEKVNH